MLTKILSKMKNNEIENPNLPLNSPPNFPPNFLPNPKYQKYADENGKIPIFVMEKKHLIADWVSKIMVIAVWIFIVFIYKSGILAIIVFSIAALFCLAKLFLHDIFVRKIICYDTYLAIYSRFTRRKIAYPQISHFKYERQSFSFTKILLLYLQGHKFVGLNEFSNAQFHKQDLEYLIKILRQKGIGEQSKNNQNQIKKSFVYKIYIMFARVVVATLIAGILLAIVTSLLGSGDFMGNLNQNPLAVFIVIGFVGAFIAFYVYFMKWIYRRFVESKVQSKVKRFFILLLLYCITILYFGFIGSFL